MSWRGVDDLQVAVVGFGSIGRRHFDNLLRAGVVRRLLVRRREGCNPSFSPPADARIVYSNRAAIAEGLDLAIVANPTSLHVETLCEYAAAGVAVLVEKPLAPDLAGCAAALEAGAQAWPAGMAYCLRYHPAYRCARQAIAAGLLGRVLYASAWFEDYLPDWHPWEDYRTSYAARPELGGGVLPTLDHELDFLGWCLGPPAQADGWMECTGALDMGAPDLAVLSIQYASGPLASVRLSLCRRDRSRGFEFVGTRGTLRYCWQTGRLDLAAPESKEAQVLCDASKFDINQMYAEMLMDVLGHIVARQDSLPVPLKAGIDALRLIGMATDSKRLSHPTGEHGVPVPHHGAAGNAAGSKW